MMKASYQVCTLFGIPIRLDLSLIVLFFLLIANYGDPLYSIGAGLALLVSIVLHELGHSLVAMAFGCKVRDITLMMIGGAATLLNMPRKAWQEFLVAAAGPLVSLILGLIGIYGFHPFVHYPSGAPTFPFFMHYAVGWLNMGLFLFNLLPAFPMDGGRILRAVLQQFFMSKLKATWVASRIGKGIAILMTLSVLFTFFRHGFRGGYIFIRLLIAWFVYQSAEREYRMVAMEENASRFTRRSFSSFFRHGQDPAPDDDGKAVVSPPPYDIRGGKTRVDVYRENR